MSIIYKCGKKEYTIEHVLNENEGTAAQRLFQPLPEDLFLFEYLPHGYIRSTCDLSPIPNHYSLAVTVDECPAGYDRVVVMNISTSNEVKAFLNTNEECISICFCDFDKVIL
jgi:hypothetical protein